MNNNLLNFSNEGIRTQLRQPAQPPYLPEGMASTSAVPAQSPLSAGSATSSFAQQHPYHHPHSHHSSQQRLPDIQLTHTHSLNNSSASNIHIHPPHLPYPQSRTNSNNSSATSNNMGLEWRRPIPYGSAPNSRNSSVPDITRTDQSDISPQKQNNNGKKPAKICKACGEPIIGTLVRAMGSMYHVECFTCYDCGQPCSNKFFAADIQDETGNLIQVPLCEYDYFKRIDLICVTCDKAVRGSYITAAGKKYHPEHFYCEICHKVFDSEDYYEYHDKIYCHYHYSKLYAAHCEACKSAILKQYVEMVRGGREQQWHPECFMVHKFWGVDITLDHIGYDQSNLKFKSIDQIKDVDEKNIPSKQLFDIEKKLERTTMSVWLTISEFEESCASCISDMLHSASNGDRLNGLLTSGRLVLKVETLFKGLDSLTDYATNFRIQLDYSSNSKLTELTKEPRSMSSKIMSYLTFLRDTDQSRIISNNFSHDLLSLISTLAHYIKLISRNSLIHALEYNKITKSTVASDKYLREISTHDSIPKDVFPILNIPQNAKDICFKCGDSIEEECFQFEHKRWHINCLHCSKCNKSLAHSNVNEIAFNPNTNSVLCNGCASDDLDAISGFKRVSKYLQLIYLLKIALVRSKYAMRKRGLIDSHSSKHSHSNIQNEDSYSQKVTDIKRMRSQRQYQKMGNAASNEARRSIIVEAPIASSAGTEDIPEETSVIRANSVPIITPTTTTPTGLMTQRQYSQRSSTRLSHNVSSSSRKTVDATKFLKKEKSLGRKGSKRLRIEDVPMKSKPQNANLDLTSSLLKNEKSLTLDDIPRIVSSEQAREHRPNAFRFQKRHYQTTTATLPTPKSVQNKVKDQQNGVKSLPNLPNTVPMPASENSSITKSLDTNVNRKRYSELSKTQHEQMRFVAAYGLHKLMNDTMTLDDCLSFVQANKQTSTFWGKLFNSKKASDNVTTVFNAPLELLVNKFGVDSDLGIGPEKLRIPTFVDEVINVMHTQDLSAEGVFRLNGNIRRLKQLVESIDANPNKPPDFNKETPIQLAALLKRFLREMPDPLLTFRLYDLFILSQKLGTEDLRKRDRILKLAYCMLPKANRDLTEVLLSFLNWVSSFCHIDEETGSKMDIHNLATVLTPNILYARPTTHIKDVPANSSELLPRGENHFLGIECINTMIESQDELSVIPTDLLELFQYAEFDKLPPNANELSTKDIMTRCKHAFDKHPNVFNNF